MSANGPVSVFRKVAIKILIFIDKGYHKNINICMFTSFITKPVDKLKCLINYPNLTLTLAKIVVIFIADMQNVTTIATSNRVKCSGLG